MSLPKLLSFHLIILLSAFTGAANGYYHSTLNECIYSSSDHSDMVYIQGYYYNKFMDIQFNSTLGEFVGFTEYGVRTAESWNKDTAYMQQVREEVNRVCKYNAELLDSAVRDKTEKPNIKVSSVKESDGKHPAVLMCSAYRFYPQKIKVTWLKNNVPETTDVTSTEEMPNGDWYYQIHSHLEYTPKSGEKISCMVEHASSTQPMIVDWNPAIKESERNKIAIGASALVLGIIIAAAGLIYYKKKSAGRILVPH
ncbi:SLA class II histocompatibility antigen, DQ haplotype C beta chain [Triplophysa tibetana]|uniref:SLA class II histocompatibility antigen, DQ haplotype C beta chain n=1 Tax=Triplophysa tibetana TaxID=1572043 RepID=A0A5A9NYL7_9TELE|nr:SLA class II histocompatibility antigen, DQ haplotype C beta chain [Triplophysa tibetana]